MCNRIKLTRILWTFVLGEIQSILKHILVTIQSLFTLSKKKKSHAFVSYMYIKQIIQNVFLKLHDRNT